MRLSDFLRPERALAFIAKLTLGLFALIIVASVILPALARLQFKITDALGMLVGLAVLSMVAYLIREHRKRERPRPRTSRGAERMPLVPYIEEEE